MSSSSALPKKASLLGDIRERRVPQIFGLFLGASWAIVQFVDWLVNRYYLSPHLTDLTLTILLTIIPSILILAYFHGKPGADKWTYFEKIGIPLNLVLLGVLVFTLFSDKNLGVTAKKIRVTNEDGKELVRTIATKDSLKKMVIFHFDTKEKDQDLKDKAWLFPILVSADLKQDSFFHIINPFDINSNNFTFFLDKDLEEAGFESGENIPLQLQAKITNSIHFSYFLRGTLSKSEVGLKAEYALHESKNQRLKASGTVEASTYLELVDQITVAIKKDLSIPKVRMDEVKDLPVVEMMTANPEALDDYLHGFRELKQDDLVKGIQLMESAIAKDPSFAQAYSVLMVAYIINNQSDKLVALYKPMMKHLYKLTERDQYLIKANYYMTHSQGDKAFAVMEMATQLFPQDIVCWGVLGLYQGLRNEFEGAIESYKRVLEIDPTAHHVLQAIGQLYAEKLGRFDEAETYFKKYADLFPNKPESHEILGNFYLDQGRFEESKACYEKALLINPSDLSVFLRLGEVATKTGDLEGTQKILDEALLLAETAEDKYNVYERTQRFHLLKGEVAQALTANALKEIEAKKFQQPIIQILDKLKTLNIYSESNRIEEGKKILEGIRQELAAPYDRFAAMGDILLYSKTDDSEALQTAVNNLETVINDFKYEVLRPIYFEGQGAVYELNGDFENALQQYQSNLKLNPQSAGIYRQIGRCLGEMGKLKDAEKALKKSLAVQPNSPKALYQMAVIQDKLGNSKKAEEHLDNALKIWKDADPSFKPAAKARALKESWRKLS